MTRSVSDSDTIPISCGHRAHRDSMKFGERNRTGQHPRLYRCETCGEWRMSGGKTTGLQSFDFLLELRDEIAARGIVVDVDDTWTKHGIAVVEALGATASRRK